MEKISKIDTYLKDIRSVAIAGHENPDGDCIGSTLGMYLYLKENFPEIRTDLYLGDFKESFQMLPGADQAQHDLPAEASYDLLILLDISGKDRIAVAGRLLETTEKILCLDHHKTNADSYTWLYNDPDASSASEVVYRHLDPEKISKACAEALYLGIVHDTGVFQYSCTSPETMRVAAALMEKGIPYSELIDQTFYQKSYEENQMLGRALLESFQMMDGKLIVSYVKAKTMKFFNIEPKQLDGIVSQLRNTEGVEVAIFLYEKGWLTYKVSLRSKSYVDVSKVAQTFGGGGHARAAGCTMQGMHRDVINNLTEEISKQLKQTDA